MKSEQEVAAALADLRLDDPVTAATFWAAALVESTFAERAAALAFRASALTEQAAMEATASPSYFLQMEKASLQAFRSSPPGPYSFSGSFSPV